MRILVTGGAGFIGSNFVRHLLRTRPHIEVINLDKLTYAGNPENLADVNQDPRYKFVRGDVADSQVVEEVLRTRLDAIVHFAAETHVDRSIEHATPFLQTNVLGTQCLLDTARRFGSPRFVHISSDEVYGTAPPEACFAEETKLAPSSPYAASKAAADHLVCAHVKTYGANALILRCANNYGPFQFPEKFISLIIANALEDKPLPLYGDGLHERDWLFVEDCCQAILAALENAGLQGIYNISAGRPFPNLAVANEILHHLGKPASLIEFVADRPGHDRRYSIDSSKFRSAAHWRPTVDFQEGIQRTIDWYKSNRSWLNRVRSGEYLDYYERHYTRRTETFSPKT